MHKKLCKNSATLFFFLCYHTSKAVFSVNVHFRISLREMPKMPRRDAKKQQKKFASHYVP